MRGLVAVLVVAIGGTAAAESPNQTRAGELAVEGTDHYKRGELDVAAVLFRRAYGLDPDPSYLYQLALSLEGIGDAKGAADAYRTYLASASSVIDRAAIEHRITALDGQVTPAPAPEPTTEPEPYRPISSPPSSLFASTPEPKTSSLPWVAIGGGAALLAGGVAVHEGLDRHPTLGTALLIAGSAATIGGVIWEVHDRKQRRDAIVRAKGPFIQLELMFR